MVALRLLNREAWERILLSQGCRREPAGLSPELETGEWWLTTHEFLFSVPCDERGLLRSDDLQRVIVEIAKLKPLDLDT